MSTTSNRQWVNQAIRKIEADSNRSADTHLFKLDLPVFPGIEIYLKDESTHPTGSLKQRLARSLFLYALCNGWVSRGTPIIEASSGSTAVSEAYFARLIGLPFIAVVPRSTSPEKIAQITFYGGHVHFVDCSSQVCSVSEQLAKEKGGHFMNQFTYAERATDWRGNNNIAESIFEQLREEDCPVPRWLVCGAGTGGTSATLGRYVRYRGFDSRVCVVDPEFSVFANYYKNHDKNLCSDRGSRIEGIGRPRVEPSFVREVVDRMEKIPDAASIAAMRSLERLIGKRPGGSTGTNFYGVLLLLREMHENREKGSIVSLICDPGDRYLNTYYNDHWLVQNELKIEPYFEQIQHFLKTGKWLTMGATPKPRLQPIEHEIQFQK